MRAIGVDVGGTTTRVGLVAGDAALLAIERFPTGTDFDWLRDSVADGVASVLSRSGFPKDQSIRIGLALPGLMDGGSGRVTRCVNLSFLEGRDPVELLPQRLRGDALVLTDAAAATWGEFSARENPPRRFAHLRLGTGVGCGVIVDGVMVELARPVDQHADVLVFNESSDAVVCKCGRRGCLEAIASRGALCDRAGECGLGSELSVLAAGVKDRNPRALELADDVASAIAVVAGKIAVEYEVEVVSIGGGVVDELPELLDRARLRINGAEAVRVDVGLLGDDAGVVGAGIRALRRS